MEFVRNQKRRTLKRLIGERPTHVRLEDGMLSFMYDGKIHRTKVNVKKHVPWVASWSWGKNQVCVDDDIRNRKQRMLLALHEGVEQYVAKRYGLNRDFEAHIAAANAERKYAKRLGVNFDTYMNKVELVFRKEQLARRKR